MHTPHVSLPRPGPCPIKTAPIAFLFLPLQLFILATSVPQCKAREMKCSIFVEANELYDYKEIFSWEIGRRALNCL